MKKNNNQQQKKKQYVAKRNNNNNNAANRQHQQNNNNTSSSSTTTSTTTATTTTTTNAAASVDEQQRIELLRRATSDSNVTLNNVPLNSFIQSLFGELQKGIRASQSLPKSDSYSFYKASSQPFYDMIEKQAHQLQKYVCVTENWLIDIDCCIENVLIF